MILRTLFRGRFVKRGITVLGLVFLVAVLIAPLPADAFWNTLGNVLVSVFLIIYNLLLNIIVWFLGILLSLAGIFTDFILDAKRIAGAPTVQAGWAFVRDSLNFVFILSLLTIAFSTIAGIESYDMRRFLPRLIIAALLMNFSLAIAGAFLQTAGVMTQAAINSLPPTRGCPLIERQTIRGTGTSLTCALANAARISEHYNFGPSQLLSTFGLPGIATFGRRVPGSTAESLLQIQIGTSANAVQGFIGTAVSATIAAFLIGLFTSAIFILCAMVGIRLVVIFLLLILSPAPFALSLIPAASEWSKKWWDSFLRYVFFLPIVVFFLVLSIHLVSQTGNFLQQEFQADGRILQPLSGTGVGETAVHVGLAIFNTMFMTVFIYVSIIVARSLSLAGAGAVTGYAKRAVRGAATLPFQGVKLGLKAAGVALGRPLGRLGYQYAVQPLGTAAGKTPYVGGALRGARAMGRGFQRLYGAKATTSDQQIEAQQKTVKGLNENTLRDACERGNLGSCYELVERDDVKDEGEFKKILGRLPEGTRQHEKTKSAYGTKFPVSAANKDNPELSHQALETSLARGGIPTRNLKSMVDSDEKIKDIRKGLSKMKDDQIKKNAVQVRAAMKAATLQIQSGQTADTEKLAVDLTSSKLVAYSRNLGPEGQKELETLLQAMGKKNMLGKSQRAAAGKEKYVI